jgi:hypothetical protein
VNPWAAGSAANRLAFLVWWGVASAGTAVLVFAPRRDRIARALSWGCLLYVAVLLAAKGLRLHYALVPAWYAAAVAARRVATEERPVRVLVPWLLGLAALLFVLGAGA